ncbi:hypothetical protein Cni_G25823 [Canna indica]|uniref:Cytochrome P450 n=1 Tax=Canna indica TaxID=4628 RepID=A0AAQ3KYG2_9LILI|nr:hypothetical protein Cni_G25823 [Canna indica]
MEASPFLIVARQLSMGLSAWVDSPWRLGSAAAAVATLLLAAAAAALLHWAWWSPRRLERALRAQGLRGTPYRFLRGDITEDARLRLEARSKPMPLSHDIIPRVVPLLHRAMNEFGRTSFTWFGTVPRVTITDPEMVREILSKKFDHFARANLSPLGRWLASGVLSYEGEKWAKHRRILNPAFHAEKLKRMLPAFSACCSDLVARWANFVGPEGSCELDVWPELQGFARDVISRAAFGSSFEEGSRIFKHQAEIASLIFQSLGSGYLPGHSFLPTPRNRKVFALDREVRSIIRGMIKKREQAIKMGGESKDDLLGLLMESNMKEYQEHGNKKARLTTEEVIEECKPFYFAGQETTSVLLTWTMVVLSMHPNWQVRAREEVLQVFGKDKPDFKGLSHLKIVTMILYEVLRLYPPVILLQRKAHDKIKIGKITYPPGLFFAVPMILIHHDQELWGKDASEFKPERFSEGIAKASKDQVAFFPFSGGPRICIGQNFALLEAKMALSMILQSFSFELSPSYTHSPHIRITLQPEHGAQLRLHKL